MARVSLQFGQLIRENVSILMTFAYSRAPLEALVEARFQGEWKHLRGALLDLPRIRANRASLELALLLRLLDDDEGLSANLIQIGAMSFGRLVKPDGSETDLTLRDVCNKIIHASDLEWRITTDPVLICTSREPQRWIRAEIHLERLAALCGLLLV
jgi:hypothetical protein